MGESLNERRRVRDEGPRVVNRCQLGGNPRGQTPLVDLASEEGRANYVPAAAVIRRVRALIGITGRKACAGGLLSKM